MSASLSSSLGASTSSAPLTWAGCCATPSLMGADPVPRRRRSSSCTLSARAYFSCRSPGRHSD
eukprot:2226250-Heterocapsa_arctica.AAC.1